VHFLQRP